MNKPSKPLSLTVLICFLITSTGCARLKPEEYATYGYHGAVSYTEGERILPVDILGNIFGALSKLILWNWKMERHWVREETQEAAKAYVEKNQAELGDVMVRFNEYAPIDSFRRLFANHEVKWPYKYTIGILTTLISDTIMIDRIFGGDRYNPFTHTIHIHSDIPSVALHELGHARDFAGRRYKGSYALLRMIPFTDLYQEYQASHIAFGYITEEKMDQRKIEAYKILYPAYGTYAGGYFLIPYGSWAGALIGHAIGRYEAHKFEGQLVASAKKT